MKVKSRIIVYLIVSALLIGILTTAVEAVYDVTKLKGTGKSKIGNVYTLSYSGTLTKYTGAYCIQRHKTLKGDVKYVLKNYVEINGRESTAYRSSTDNNPRVVNNDLNAEMAYILNMKQGYGSEDEPTDAQYAIWNLTNSWTSVVFGNNQYYWYKNTGVNNALLAKAKEYAQSVGKQKAIENGSSEDNADILNIKDETNKDNITKIDVGDYYRIGPFKWTFDGILKGITVSGDKEKYSNFKIIKYSGNVPKEVEVSSILTGESFYIDVEKKSKNTQFKEMKINVISSPEQSMKIYTAKIWFFYSYDKQNMIYADTGDVETKPIEAEKPANYDIDLTTDIGLLKVDDRDINVPLDKVGFVFKSKVYRYIDNGSNKEWKWVVRYLGKDLYWSEEDINNAAVYYTDKDGKIELEKVSGETIVKDSLKAVEVYNSHYGYEDNIGKEYKAGTIQKAKRGENHQNKVKLSGYVWLDIHSSKVSQLNDVYDEESEKGFNDIPVYLKDRSGNIIMQTKTAERGLYSEIEGGEYQFVDVDLDKLQAGEYYIEFEYAGVTYKTVAANIDKKNGSKALDTDSREKLDNKFSSLDATGTQTLYANEVTLNYNDISNMSSSINSITGDEVYANTNEAQYNIYSDFQPATEEIRYINLGLVEKVQADYSLVQDLYNVKVDVNGFSHIYKYGATRYRNDGSVDKESVWNMGVKFQRSNGTYSRAIYATDVNYEAPEHKDNEIKVYVTYKIALMNEGSYLGRINSIIDYCDNRYDLVNVGTEIDDSTSNITGNLNYSSKEVYNDEYSRFKIDVNTVLEPEQIKFVYVQYKMEREAILKILNNGELLQNVAEINSYTTFKDNDINKTLAVFDHDSVPGNAKPGQQDTYEDDTDNAKSLQLELKNARAVQGTVFVDDTGKQSDIVYSGEERRGNGIFDSGEQTISGVAVKMREVGKDDSSYDLERVEIDTVTDADGNFEFVGFIPGNYVITYTWGNETYKVQYYKGTIYDSNRNQNDTYWYKEDVDTRKTDALDNLEIRTKIDDEMKNIKYNTIEDEINKAYTTGSTSITQTTMDSLTPTMSFSVEYETTITDGTEDQVKFTVKNVDFGIVERPKQQLDISKRISSFKIRLANGNVLADIEVLEDGTLKGSNNYVSYLPPVLDSNGRIRVEMDNEIIQGSTLELTYTIKVTNTGEKDYISDKYYHYGDSNGAEPVKVSATGVIDYLDNRLVMIDDKWEEKNKDYLELVNASQKDNDEYLNATNTYFTTQVSKELAQGESSEVTMTVSKQLSSSDENSFDNESEIVEVTKVKPNEGTDIFNNLGTPVKVTWKLNKFFFSKDNSETFTIIPSTGEDKSNTMIIVLSLTTLVVLGLGIIITKKFIIKNK